MVTSSVAMVVEIDVRRFSAFAIPTENKPPLAIDPDRMKTGEIAAQLLEMIAGRHAQILICRGIIDHLEFAEETAIEIWWNVPGMALFQEEGLQPVIPKTHDHRLLQMT